MGDRRELRRELRRKAMYVYPWWIHVDVWWKPSQYCKGILLQLKVKQNLKKIKLKKETG